MSASEGARENKTFIVHTSVYLHMYKDTYIHIYVPLQFTATHGIKLHRTATICVALQHTATHCNTLLECTREKDVHSRPDLDDSIFLLSQFMQWWTVMDYWNMVGTATYCSTLQQIATHCNTLRHIATHRNTLPHTTTHCDTLQRTAVQWNMVGLSHVRIHYVPNQTMSRDTRTWVMPPILRKSCHTYELHTN